MKQLNIESLQFLENLLLSLGRSSFCPTAGLFQCVPEVGVDERVPGADMEVVLAPCQSMSGFYSRPGNSHSPHLDLNASGLNLALLVGFVLSGW